MRTDGRMNGKQAERQTDRHDKAFQNFLNVPKNDNFEDRIFSEPNLCVSISSVLRPYRCFSMSFALKPNSLSYSFSFTCQADSKGSRGTYHFTNKLPQDQKGDEWSAKSPGSFNRAKGPVTPCTVAIRTSVLTGWVRKLLPHWGSTPGPTRPYEVPIRTTLSGPPHVFKRPVKLVDIASLSTKFQSFPLFCFLRTPAHLALS